MFAWIDAEKAEFRFDLLAMEPAKAAPIPERNHVEYGLLLCAVGDLQELAQSRESGVRIIEPGGKSVWHARRFRCGHGLVLYLRSRLDRDPSSRPARLIAAVYRTGYAVPAFAHPHSPAVKAAIEDVALDDCPRCDRNATARARKQALVHESKLARHGPNHRCFIDRRRRKLGGPCRSSHSAYCTRAALRPFSHRVSWLEDHRR